MVGEKQELGLMPQAGESCGGSGCATALTCFHRHSAGGSQKSSWSFGEREEKWLALQALDEAGL